MHYAWSPKLALHCAFHVLCSAFYVLEVCLGSAIWFKDLVCVCLLVCCEVLAMVCVKAIELRPVKRWPKGRGRAPEWVTVSWEIEKLDHPLNQCKCKPFGRSHYHEPNRVNRAHWPTKENKQNFTIFCIFPAHGKIDLKWPQMGPGGFLSY